MQLHDYQQAAIADTYSYLRKHPGSNPAIVIPTGGGKTVVIAQVARDVVSKNKRIAIITHRAELIEQAASTIEAWHGIDAGIYSAGLKRKDTFHSVICASIQSLAKRPYEIGKIDVVLIDEAHHISSDEESQYQQVLGQLRSQNEKLIVIGLTATPYRTGQGCITECSIFDEISYQVSVADLITGGYLCEVRSKGTAVQADMSNVKIQRGEFSNKGMEQAFSEVLESAIEDVLEQTKDRKSVIIFCSSIAHAKCVAALLELETDSVGYVDGKSTKEERATTCEAFANGELRYLINVNVLTEGFDAKCVDCVVLLRATISPGLYAQMVGRGLRKHESKEYCRVLDYGGNIERHGPIDAVRVSQATYKEGEAPQKRCVHCDHYIHASLRECNICEGEQPTKDYEPTHDDEASSAAILSSEVERVEYEIHDIFYAEHQKNDSKSMRVDYFQGLEKVASEWVCVEHSGYARKRACDWWADRTYGKQAPHSVEEAIAQAQCIEKPVAITCERQGGEKYFRIVNYRF